MIHWRRPAGRGGATPDDLDRSFASLVGARSGVPAVRVGIEHEYRVLEGARPADFRDVIGELDLGLAHLDPRDAFGFRLPSGAWLTCDEEEAEIAMPPVRLSAGFGAALASTAAQARSDLERLLPRGLRPDGFSTHINVSTPERLRLAVAHLFARTFAPALMLFLDRRDSPGLLVRSRPGRTELGGEFIDGRGLVVAALLAAGGVLACLRRVAGDRRAGDLPAELSVDLAREWRRYGWYVDRRAFGPDLYDAGRRAILTTTRGERLAAQSILSSAWRAARAQLPRGIDRVDLDRAEAMVSGALPPPCEAECSRLAEDRPAESVLCECKVYASAIRPRSRPAFELGAVLSTWELTVFVVVDRARTRRAFACVPDPCLGTFLDLLDRGSLDGILERYLAHSPGSRSLEGRHHARRPGLWDRLGPRRSLLQPELVPQGTRP